MGQIFITIVLSVRRPNVETGTMSNLPARYTAL